MGIVSAKRDHASQTADRLRELSRSGRYPLSHLSQFRDLVEEHEAWLDHKVAQMKDKLEDLKIRFNAAMGKYETLVGATYIY